MAESRQTILYTAAVLFALVLGCVLILAEIDDLTRDRIDDNRQLAIRKVITDIVPGKFTNDIFNDRTEVIAPGYLGTRHPVSVYHARNGGLPLGVVFYPVTATGYNGPIELAIGISRDGTISGVRVINENETEGLGDQVNQQNSDWIKAFTGKSYASVPADQWTLSSEQGEFDQISGATITSRSVINSVKNSLDFHSLEAENLYMTIPD